MPTYHRRQESSPGPRANGFLPSYDPENEGAWNGQLPNPDLVDQLPPESIERKPGGMANGTVTEWPGPKAYAKPRVGHRGAISCWMFSRATPTPRGDAGLEWTCWPMIPECRLRASPLWALAVTPTQGIQPGSQILPRLPTVSRANAIRELGDGGDLYLRGIPRIEGVHNDYCPEVDTITPPLCVRSYAHKNPFFF